MTAETKCRLWVMERAVYVAIKRTYTAQLATQKRELLDRVPMLSTLSQVCASLLHCNHSPRAASTLGSELARPGQDTTLDGRDQVPDCKGNPRAGCDSGAEPRVTVAGQSCTNAVHK